MSRPSSPSKSNACAARQAGFTGAPGGRLSFLRCSRSSYPSVKRLLTITGVNVNVEQALSPPIGDIRRFSSPQKLVSYVGLNPRVRQSGLDHIANRHDANELSRGGLAPTA